MNTEQYTKFHGVIMSKELWCDAYNEKFDECLEQGMTTDQADQESINRSILPSAHLIDSALNRLYK